MATLLRVTVSLAFTLMDLYSAQKARDSVKQTITENRYSNKINIYSLTLVHLAYDQMRMGHAPDVK